jgi:hypothetical protein
MSTNAQSSSCPTAKSVQQKNGFMQFTQSGMNRGVELPMPTSTVKCDIRSAGGGVCTNKTPAYALLLKEAVYEKITTKPSCGV